MLETVFYCLKDEQAIPSTDQALECPVCHEPMQDIGWFESPDCD